MEYIMNNPMVLYEWFGMGLGLLAVAFITLGPIYIFCNYLDGKYDK